jgi:hypothetical protein
MSNFLRNMQRKVLRTKEGYKPAPQPTVSTDDGYWTLRPTKGWAFFSNRRIEAGQRMAVILGGR